MEAEPSEEVVATAPATSGVDVDDAAWAWSSEVEVASVALVLAVDVAVSEVAGVSEVEAGAVLVDARTLEQDALA